MATQKPDRQVADGWIPAGACEHDDFAMKLVDAFWGVVGNRRAAAVAVEDATSPIWQSWCSAL